jgi:putative transposase
LPAEDGANRRESHSKKTVLVGTSKTTLSVPRQCGTSDPRLIARYQSRNSRLRRQELLDLCCARHDVREIRSHLEELYGVDV